MLKMNILFRIAPIVDIKNTDGKFTLSELWTEFQGAVFNIESITWRTLKNILTPGRLT